MYHAPSACEVGIHIQATFHFSVSVSLLKSAKQAQIFRLKVIYHIYPPRHLYVCCHISLWRGRIATLIMAVTEE